MPQYVTDAQGIQRFTFPDMESYKEVYSSKEAVFPNIDLKERHVRTNYRWQIVENILKHSGKKRIIDFGCGDGAFGFLLEKQGYDYTGVEIDETVSRASADLAREWESSCKFINSSVEEFTSQDRWDIALVLDVFEHFMDWKKAMSVVESHVTPRGAVIIATPHIDGTFGKNDPSPHHINLHSEDSLRECFKDRTILCLETIMDIIFLVYTGIPE